MLNNYILLIDNVISFSLHLILTLKNIEMKKIKLLFIVALLPLFSIAQGGAEIIPFAGYMFGGSVNFYEGKYKITDGVDYGLSVLVPIREVVDVELNYTRMDSEGKFTAYSGYPGFVDKQTVMSTNYFQVGAVKAFTKQNPKIIPFGFNLNATGKNKIDKV